MRYRQRYLGQTPPPPPETPGKLKKLEMWPLLLVGMAVLIGWALPGGLLGLGQKKR